MNHTAQLHSQTIPAALPSRASRLGYRITGALSLTAVGLGLAAWALLLLTDVLVDAFDESTLLVAWTAFWAFAFIALALFSDVLMGWGRRLADVWNQRAARRHAARQDEVMRQTARTDPRVMADLQGALLHARADAELAVAPARAAYRSNRIESLYELTARLRAAGSTGKADPRSAYVLC